MTLRRADKITPNHVNRVLVLIGIFQLVMPRCVRTFGFQRVHQYLEAS